MAIEVLIYAATGNPTYPKGTIAFEKDSPVVWGSSEGLPNFIQVEIIGTITAAQARQYRNNWILNFDFEVLQHQLAPDGSDGYRIRIFVVNDNLSNEAAPSRGKVENFLTRWGMVYQSATLADVRFDYSILSVCGSSEFWGANVSLVTLLLLDRNDSTGLHQISADYSGAPWADTVNPLRIERFVNSRGGTVISHDMVLKVLIFEINRSDVNSYLKEVFKIRFDRKFEERQYLVDSAFIDTVVSEGGRREGMTTGEFLALLNNRLNDKWRQFENQAAIISV